MATGDIYHAVVNCSTNNRAWSFGLHYEETNPSSMEDRAQLVADSLVTHLLATLTGVLSTESFFESVYCTKLFGVQAIPGLSVVGTGGVGTRAGDTLPNDNALMLQLRQIARPANRNGKIFIAGQTATDHTDNKWTSAYLNGNVATFAAQLEFVVNAIAPETGSWRLVVLSQADAVPTTPAGTPLDVTDVVATTRVMTQSRRRQRNVGWSV